MWRADVWDTKAGCWVPVGEGRLLRSLERIIRRCWHGFTLRFERAGEAADFV
jgi:hypothetical protein